MEADAARTTRSGSSNDGSERSSARICRARINAAEQR
jgi:hypothetical protein